MNAGEGGLHNKGRYGCAASAKPRPGKISPKNLMPGQVFMNFIVQMGHIFHSFINYTFFVNNCLKPNARAKLTSQNLMPRQKLILEKPNARARTSVPTFIRESPPRMNACTIIC